jgi:hypothetical protein
LTNPRLRRPVWPVAQAPPPPPPPGPAALVVARRDAASLGGGMVPCARRGVCGVCGATRGLDQHPPLTGRPVTRCILPRIRPSRRHPAAATPPPPDHCAPWAAAAAAAAAGNGVGGLAATEARRPRRRRRRRACALRRGRARNAGPGRAACAHADRRAARVRPGGSGASISVAATPAVGRAAGRGA